MSAPICDRCGVEYVESYEGPCQERRWVDLKDMGPCGGSVSWQATCAKLEAELADARSHAPPVAGSSTGTEDAQGLEQAAKERAADVYGTAGFDAPLVNAYVAGAMWAAARPSGTEAGKPVWRVGRSVGRTIYRQVGAEPSKGDVLIGLMDTPELAALVVAAVSGNRPSGTEEELRKALAEALQVIKDVRRVPGVSWAVWNALYVRPELLALAARAASTPEEEA